MRAEHDKENWDSDEREVLRENTAQAIHEQLESQDNLRNKYARRWIWELFQNALDASREDGNVRIHIRSGETFTFSHNGLPFTRKEILHLIFHGSTKRDLRGTIGRYGTGFLTTHVLSRRIQVRGQLDTGQDFDFLLDRSGNNPNELMDEMETSRQQLLLSLSDRADGKEKWTEFDYALNGTASDIVGRALSDFSKIATAVVAFNTKIKSIELSGRFSGRYELLAKDELSPKCVLLRIGDPENEAEIRHIVVAKDDAVAVAIPLGGAEGDFSIVSTGDIPRLFVAFPLFGTEAIPIPFLLDCQQAMPTEERDGLFLGSDDREANTSNKALVERSWQLYRTILEESSARRWKDLYRLASVGNSPPVDWLDCAWLDSVLRANVKESFLPCAIVETSSDGILAPGSATFPVGVPEEQFPVMQLLVEQLYRERVVRSDVGWAWCQNLMNWHELDADVRVNEIDLSHLTRTVAEFGTLEALAKSLDNSIGAHDWLNRFLTLLNSCKTNWNSVGILPNQLGRFTSMLRLQRDDGIDEELKDVSALLEEDIRTQLLDTRITSDVQAPMSPLGQEKVVGTLLSGVRARKNAVPAGAAVEANVRLLAWLIKHRRFEDLKTYPFIVRATDSHGIEIEGSPSAQLLSPPEIWPETAQKFVDLFPAEHVISSAYVRVLSSEDWKYLSAQGICGLDPLIRTSRLLDSDEVSSMVEEVQSVETSEHNIPMMDVSDVAFISLKDKGLLDAARSSKSKSVAFLAFLFEHVIPQCADDLKYRDTQCSCGERHALHSAAWLTQIKDRKWVYESRGHSAHVSSASLGRLLKDEPSLLERLGEDSIFTFLARLRVSPSELRRAALNLPDNEMARLERAVLGVLSASKNDPGQLDQIADLVSSAPELLVEFQERKKTKERVHKNQALGALVEQLFRELFTSAEIEGIGLQLKRTGIGSDFALENDLIDNGEESLFDLKGEGKELLIELKATLGNSAAMTHTQANLASGRGESFVLCVVPLEDREPTADLVKAQCRFVPGIGARLIRKVSMVETIKSLQGVTALPSNGVQVTIAGGEFRYRISEEVWNEGLSFDNFKEFLVSFFRQT